MWPDLLRGIMGNLSTYGLQNASQVPLTAAPDPQLGGDLAMADRNLARYQPIPPMNPNPSIDEMIAIAQQMGRQPKTEQLLTPDAPPQTPADATRVTRPQGKQTQQTMLNMLMQHLLAANDAPPFMDMGAKRRSPEDWQKVYKYYHPTLTPGQPLPLRLR